MQRGQNPYLGKHFSAFTTNIFFMILGIVGLCLIPLLTVKLNPQAELSAVSIGFSYPVASAEVVEHDVTNKLEGAFSTIEGVAHVRSRSSKGYGNITLEADKDADIARIRFEVLSIIKDIWQRLPQEVSYPSVSQGHTEDEDKTLLMSFTLNGEGDSWQLKRYAESILRPKFASIEGISGIAVYGATLYEWVVEYDQQQLDRYRLSVSLLQQAIAAYDQKNSLGIVLVQKLNGQKAALEVSMQDRNKEKIDLKKIPVTNVDGRIIYLGELAHILNKQQQTDSYFRINGLTTLNINIFCDKSANQIALAKKIYRIEQQIKKELIQCCSLQRTFDASEYLKKEISKTLRRVSFSFLFLFLFIFLINRRLRFLLLIGLSLLITLLTGVILLYLFKIEIHLVSIAGITVSLGIIIDNAMMMTDHLTHHRGLKIYTAILGSTLAIIGSLAVIVFLKQEQRQNLTDFAGVVIINLVVSLVVSLFFIPALTEKIAPHTPFTNVGFRWQRFSVRFLNIYSRYIHFAVAKRWIFILFAILLFGLPFFMLPVQLKGDGEWTQLYNKTIGSDFYQNTLRPYLDNVLGGTFRLFVQGQTKVSYDDDSQKQTNLYVYISLPTGASVIQMNELCVLFEKKFSQYKEIKQYQTSISGAQQASIVVYFTKEAENSGFPFILKAEAESFANTHNGADFNIYGVGQGFSNALNEVYRSSQIKLAGYSYRELLHQAFIVKDSLVRYPRIQNIAITSGEYRWNGHMLDARFMDLNKYRIQQDNGSYYALIGEMQKYSSGIAQTLTIRQDGDFVPVSLSSDQSKRTDAWQLMQIPLTAGKGQFKLKSLATFSNGKIDEDIVKEDQNYVVTIAYDFIGSYELSEMIQKREITRLNNVFPLGYTAKSPDHDYSYWDSNEISQYWLILLIMLVIYAICAIIFESLVQPLVIIAIIPLSFVGIFLTFYFFNIPFDQGGYASFLFLSGLVVNSGIYIFNDINKLRNSKPWLPLHIYLKAYNFRIILVTLTTFSTILGLLPFILFDRGTSFWYALAAGTTGGLVFSIPMLMVFMPLMVKGMRSSLKSKT